MFGNFKRRCIFLIYLCCNTLIFLLGLDASLILAFVLERWRFVRFTHVSEMEVSWLLHQLTGSQKDIWNYSFRVLLKTIFLLFYFQITQPEWTPKRRHVKTCIMQNGGTCVFPFSFAKWNGYFDNFVICKLTLVWWVI